MLHRISGLVTTQLPYSMHIRLTDIKQAFLRKMCTGGKTINVWMSNFMLLCTLQDEKYASIFERFYLSI